jgi:hypothetical protein
VTCPQWRPHLKSRSASREVMTYCGVAVKH